MEIAATSVNNRYLDRLQKRPLIFDGGMATSLQGMGVTAEGGLFDLLSLNAPEKVAAVHRSFLQAGADVIETNTFRANRPALAEYGLGEQVGAINRAAAELARRVADAFSTAERPRFVAGAMGPVGEAGVEGAVVAAVFGEQAAALLEGGVDLIVLETFQDGRELAAAVEGVRRAMARMGQWRPIQAQVSPGMGVERPWLETLLALTVEIIGVNCGYGPAGMGEALAYLAGRSDKPIVCLPNAGIPKQVDGAWVYPVEAAEFANVVMGYAREYGLRAVGGCCGTTPAYTELLAKGAKRGLSRIGRNTDKKK
jgi:5-methyltetrahydrofolate--homocysteine methyltransferase